jgi:hypothetical protein
MISDEELFKELTQKPTTSNERFLWKEINKMSNDEFLQFIQDLSTNIHNIETQMLNIEGEER